MLPWSLCCLIVAPAQEYRIALKGQRLIYNHGRLNQHHQTSAWHCGLSCEQGEGCVSYNFQKSTQLCELFGVKYSDVIGKLPITLTPDASFRYYERTY